MREITIQFNVTGTCCQTIQIEDECELTDKEIIEGLEHGALFTTVQDGGDLLELSGVNQLVQIGFVCGSDTDCEYKDFEDVSL